VKEINYIKEIREMYFPVLHLLQLVFWSIHLSLEFVCLPWSCFSLPKFHP